MPATRFLPRWKLRREKLAPADCADASARPPGRPVPLPVELVADNVGEDGASEAGGEWGLTPPWDSVLLRSPARLVPLPDLVVVSSKLYTCTVSVSELTARSDPTALKFMLNTLALLDPLRYSPSFFASGTLNTRMTVPLSEAVASMVP